MAHKRVTVRKAAEILKLTTRMVHYLIPTRFPGAEQVDPDVENSTVLIPMDEVLAEKKRREKNEK